MTTPQTESLLRQALEALTESIDVVRNEHSEAAALWAGYPTRQGRVDALKAGVDFHEATIEAIRSHLFKVEAASVRTFDQWWTEIENFAMRGERLADLLSKPALAQVAYDEGVAAALLSSQPVVAEQPALEHVATVAVSPMATSVGWIKSVPHNTKLYAEIPASTTKEPK